MKRMIFSLMLCTSLINSNSALGNNNDYKITTSDDGGYAFEIKGITFNEGSTLQRQSILFNTPNAPVHLISHSTKAELHKGRILYSSTTRTKVHKPIQAIEFRTLTYNAFGLLIDDLSRVVVRDIVVGKYAFNSKCDSHHEKAGKFLTSVTYLGRILYTNGTQWIFNKETLYKALDSLKLEKNPIRARNPCEYNIIR